MDRSGRLAFMDNRDEFDNESAQSVRIRPAILVAVWTAPALLSSLQRWAGSELEGHPLSFWTIAASDWPGWYLWALLTPAIFELVRRFPFNAPNRMRDVIAHVAGWTVCLFLHATVTSAVARAMSTTGNEFGFARYVAVSALSWLPSTFLLYVATVGVALWMRSVQRERKRHEESAQLGVALARAELSALRSQLHPHFLFNTLNTIAILIRERDTEASARLVTQLGDVLRYVLLGTRLNETALKDEVTLVHTYLEIERVRFGNRLQLNWAVPESLLEAIVPTLVLQPLVENALRHGIAERNEGGVVEIGARLHDGVLALWVADNGVAVLPQTIGKVHTGNYNASASREAGGVGIRNTRERLARLYPDHSSFELSRSDSGVTRAEIRLPYRIA